MADLMDYILALVSEDFTTPSGILGMVLGQDSTYLLGLGSVLEDHGATDRFIVHSTILSGDLVTLMAEDIMEVTMADIMVDLLSSIIFTQMKAEEL